MSQDILSAALHWTAEYKVWDWGIYSFGVVLMIVFTGTETYGILSQAYTIRRKESTEAVESELFFYSFFFFQVCLFYAFRIHGAVAIINCVVTAYAQWRVLREIYRCRPFDEREQRVGSAYALLPAIQLWGVSHGLDGYTYMVFAIGMWWAFFEQLRKLWSEWVVGAVDIKMYIVYFFTCFVWAGYAFYTGDIFFEISMIGSTVFVTAIWALWGAIRLGYPKPQAPDWLRLGSPLRKRWSDLLGR